ncbi:MAG: biotin synthase BioB [Deltaproteobacteria bacterium]|nr:biotin synthase BioB [Deltaproteobacteria bacterium]
MNQDADSLVDKSEKQFAPGLFDSSRKRDAEPRSTWTREEIRALFDQPFLDLVYQASEVHRTVFDPNEVQMSQLLSIKTGACSEDCGYCSQSSKNETGLERERLIDVDTVLQKAKSAKDSGATRYCMGAAWRSPKAKDMPALQSMVRGVRELGMETCMTLGMLDDGQVSALQEAGLDYYNHNLDTSPEYYGDVITTRTYQDRLDTLQRVRDAGISVCSGGIVGMGEAREDRVGLLHSLATLEEHPQSVPVNLLVKVKGTPLAQVDELDPFEFARTVAVARILMPRSLVRLSAGREHMSDELQALCFMAGANSIFSGDELLTTKNPGQQEDARLFKRLGLRPSAASPLAGDEVKL